MCLHWCTMSVSSRPLAGGAVVLAKPQGEQLPCKKVNKWFSICVASDGGSVLHCSIKESPQENKMYSLTTCSIKATHGNLLAVCVLYICFSKICHFQIQSKYVLTIFDKNINSPKNLKLRTSNYK